MKLPLAKWLVEAAENAGNEAELRDDYHGRGMGDTSTNGVVVDSAVQLLSDVIQYVGEQVRDIDGEMMWEGGIIPEIQSLRIDNMGAGKVIIY